MVRFSLYHRRVEQYNRDLAEWEYQVSRKPTTSTKEQHRPPEKQSVLKHLREIQERNKLIYNYKINSYIFLICLTKYKFQSIPK